MIKCIKCSEEYSDNMNYCPRCGFTSNFKKFKLNIKSKTKEELLLDNFPFKDPKWKRDLKKAKEEMKLSLIQIPPGI